MNCPNCGTQVDANDTYCSYCGAKVHHQPIVEQSSINPGSGSSSWRNTAPSKRHDADSKKNVRALLLSILGIIVAIALAAFIFNYINHNNEEALWEECVSKKQIDDLRSYMEKYPEGEHYQEAKAMLDKLVMEKETWEQARASNDEDHLRSYIRYNPDSEHLAEARSLLDDIVWNKALATNTKEAFEQYIKEFPDGTHLADARNHFDEKRLAELTPGECDNVKSTIQNFLLALEEWDANLMLTTCNAQMANFMGKSNASLNDVREYYDAYRESDIDSIRFTALDVDVQKVIKNDKRAEYKVAFTATRRTHRTSAHVDDVAAMSGRAVVDDRYRFTQLTMDKVPQ